LGTATKLN